MTFKFTFSIDGSTKSRQGNFEMMAGLCVIGLSFTHFRGRVQLKLTSTFQPTKIEGLFQFPYLTFVTLYSFSFFMIDFLFHPHRQQFTITEHLLCAKSDVDIFDKEIGEN